MKRYTSLVAALLVFAIGLSTANAAIIFDNFNVNEGRFGLAPGFSGSSVGEDSVNSTADRVTTDGPLEGAGHQKLVIVHDVTTTPLRIRHLSGGGSAGGASGQPANTPFTTSAGVDGSIGFYLKTVSAGWNTQMWIEGPENNGSAQKNVIADGAWHLYEWNLDDQTGGVDGWQATGIPGIIGGDIDVQDGTYTIDSILLRNGLNPTSTIYLDFVAKSDAGSIAGLLNTPPTVVDAVIGPPYNANEPGEPQTLMHQFLATDTETPAGPFTWDMLSLVSYTANYGGMGPGPAVAATLTGGGLFEWISEGSPRGDYVWSVRGTDPGGLSDTGNITVHVTEVPEPSIFILAGLGLLGIVMAGRRRNF